MANRKKKPYEKKTRPITVTLPNVMVDRLETEMAARGEENMSAKFTEILGYWIEHALGDQPISGVKEVGDTDNLYEELNRYSGFSSSPFVGGK